MLKNPQLHTKEWLFRVARAPETPEDIGSLVLVSIELGVDWLDPQLGFAYRHAVFRYDATSQQTHELDPEVYGRPEDERREHFDKVRAQVGCAPQGSFPLLSGGVERRYRECCAAGTSVDVLVGTEVPYAVMKKYPTGCVP